VNLAAAAAPFLCTRALTGRVRCLTLRSYAASMCGRRCVGSAFPTDSGRQDVRHTVLTLDAMVHVPAVVKAKAAHAHLATTERYVHLANVRLGASPRRRSPASSGRPPPMMVEKWWNAATTTRPPERQKPGVCGVL
jgi:hypothetical protein